MCFVAAGGAGDFCFRQAVGEIFFCLTLCVYRILWGSQKWMKNAKKDFDPDPTSGSDLG